MCKENIYLFFLSLTILIQPYCNAEGMYNDHHGKHAHGYHGHHGKHAHGYHRHDHGYGKYNQKESLFTGNVLLKLTSLQFC